MAEYNVQREARNALLNQVLTDSRLGLSPAVIEACKEVTFVGDDKPFIPTPLKITESSSALSGLVGALASVVAAERYGVHQGVEINTDKATLFLMSVLLPTVNGVSFLEVDIIRKAMAEADIYDMGKPIHRQCTNIYQCKDKRWFHLHGSMNASRTMEMVGVPEQDVTKEEAQKIYGKKVAQWNSEEIDQTANEKYHQAGVICNTPEEFFATPHGKIMGEEPLYTLTPIKAPRKSWPKSTSEGFRPLEGVKVIDFSRVIAAPAASKLLAALGADVIKISCSNLPDIDILLPDMNTGKRDVDLDLKTEAGKAEFKRILKDADVLVDGYRPGAFERLGFTSATLREINPSLIYVRENCYGFKGPLSHRSGWQQVSDCLVGLSWLQGKFMGLNEPVVPLLPNSDYQTGLIGAAAIIQALLTRTQEDVTFDIDISLTQYNIWYYRLGQYDEQQSKELLARNPGFSVRHYDEMTSLLSKSLAAVNTSRPGLVKTPEFYLKMSGKEWGVGDMSILGAPFNLEKSVIDYRVPSGRRGWATLEWKS
ncbi:hypothetical protein BP6252_11151 [Coleophoma cylindrospora]|uniref:Uncharacterized protein n=1 Tax=Coleophoma cylindrospora TaxID=1849047 RepID=A0A3D8QP48_9HELO|nr:hypothetical protein BP6252_11151 [Coleophoma cylindrospora]